MSESSGPAYDDCVRTLGTILTTLSPGLFRAALPNGKSVIAHLSKALAADPPDLPDGSEVVLEMSPFDLDRARIAKVEKAADRD